MAINFLNTVDLNFNQLNKAAIQNLSGDPAAGVLGQIYYDTAVSALKICTTAQVVGVSNAVWTEVGATSGVETISIGNANVNAGGVNTGLVRTPGTGIGDVVITPAIYGGGANVGMVPTGGAANKYLDGTGAWIDVTTGDIESVLEATANNRLGIDVVDPGGPDPVVGLDVVGLTNLGATPATNDELIIYDTSTTTNKAVTVGNLVGGFETTYTIDVPTGTTNINLKGSDLTNDPITISGTTGQTAMSRISASELRVALTDDVTIVDDLTVGGELVVSGTGTSSFAGPLSLSGSKLTNVGAGVASTDGVNLGQVELLVAGVGVFKGGYNATTDPGTPKISGGSNIALDQGDYFIVTHDGDITFSGTITTGVNNGALASSTALLLQSSNTNIAAGMDVTGAGVPPGITIASVTNSSNFVLSSAITIPNATTLTFSNKVVSVEVGDFIFANAAIVASSDPAASAYTIVQADANIAGAGATDGATEKGVSGFDSANFTVSASGWVQLKRQANPYGISVPLTGGTDSGGETTFTVDITTAARFGAGALAANCKAEVVTTSGRQTVYPDITGNGTGSMDFKFIPTVADSVYTALITIV